MDAPKPKFLLRIDVIGKPEPRGSKTANAVYNKQTKKPLMKGRRVIVAQRDSNKHSGEWMGIVASAASKAFEAAGYVELFTGPLVASCVFTLVRPGGHFGKGARSSALKASSPAFPAIKPDVTKLWRGTEDALTGIVFRDDTQVVRAHIEKVYGASYGAVIRIWALPETVGDLEAEMAVQGET